MKVKIYSILVFMNSYLTGLLLPVLSLLLIEKGATLSNLSIIIGIYSFTVLVLEVPTGVMADVMGRKKTFCLSLLISMISFLVILFGHGLLILCIGIILYGIQRALSSGSFDAIFIDYYIDTFGKDKLQNITTRLTVLDALGLSFGALSGGFLPKISHDWFPGLGTYDLNIIIKIIVTAIVAVLSIIFISDKTTKQYSERISVRQHVKNSSTFVAKNKTVIGIFISMFSTGFFLVALETYWQPHFASFLTDKNQTEPLGIMSFSYLAAVMVGSIFSNKIVNKYRINSRKIYLSLRLFLAFSLIFTAIQTKMSSYMMLYAITYFIFGMANIPEGVILNGEIPGKIRASILSVNSLILQIGSLSGAFVNSIIIKYTSIPKLWIIAAIIIIISTLISMKKLLATSNRQT